MSEIDDWEPRPMPPRGSAGWQPEPEIRSPREDAVTPTRRRTPTSSERDETKTSIRPGGQMSQFQKLAFTHALQTAADAAMLVALADSVFLSISPGEAKDRVLLYLLIVFAPLAFVAPLLGPVIDRVSGGRKFIVMGTTAVRALLMLLMMSNLDNFGLYPLAFAVQVLQKTYGISKAALVPSVVSSDVELVEANSKLGVIGGTAGLIGIIPAGIFSAFGWPKGALFVALALYAAATVAGLRLPGEVIAARPAEAVERAELRSARIQLAASAMTLLRGCVGFLILHLMFQLSADKADKAKFGVAMGLGALGILVGNVLGPRLRRLAREEVLLTGALVLSAVTGVFAGFMGSLVAGILLAIALNLSSAIGRLAFDAILQQNTPASNRGRAFAQFEVRFGLAFVLAGVIPVLIDIPVALGYLLIGLACVFAVAMYLVSMRRVHLGKPVPDTPSTYLRRGLSHVIGRIRRPVR